jgi:hypothetical protein
MSAWTAEEADEFVAYFEGFPDRQYVEVPSDVGPTFARALRDAKIPHRYSPESTVSCPTHSGTHMCDRFTRVVR